MNDIIDCTCSIQVAMTKIQGICHINSQLLPSSNGNAQRNVILPGSGWFEAEEEGAFVQGFADEESIVLECHYEGHTFSKVIALERIGMKSAVFQILE